MPQNRDDNARGLPPSDRNMDECGEHDDHGGVFASYASFLKDSWGPRGALPTSSTQTVCLSSRRKCRRTRLNLSRARPLVKTLTP